MENANGLNTPLPTTANVLPAQDNEQVRQSSENKQFRSLIGSLMYLACIKPDISFAVAVLARHVHASTMRHLPIVRKALCYVAGMVNYGLAYPRPVKTTAKSIRAHCDADCGGCKENR